MNQLVVVVIIILIFIICLLVYNILLVNSSRQQQRSSGKELELSVHKLVQENFFQFQNALFSQLDQDQSQSKFIFEELQKSQSQLTSSISQRLQEIKGIVDEKLHKTLEERLTQSFKIVSDSLLKVQQGLGEMQVLAHGVGDLKRVLSNTKLRGVLGEIQLHSLLEQLLTQEQYSLNVSPVPNSRNHVEFAIKFPGNTDELPYIWLPVDSKFPMEVYEHLLDAYEDADKLSIDKAKKNLATSIRAMAADINKKYIYPPYTTEFAIMFLPTESLYAEVLRIPGLIMDVQAGEKIMVVGPNNLGAFLSSLQQGFRSLALEKRTGEVWKLLNVVRTEFGKFGDILDKTQRKILEANKIIDTASAKSRNIERKLKSIERIKYLE